MKPDATPSAAKPAEATWVEGELVRTLLRTQRTTQFLALSLVPVLLVMLWRDMWHTGLLAWALLTIFTAGARFSVLRVYARDVQDADAQAQIAFVRRWGLVWPASGVAWGLSTLLFFDRVSLQDQFVCWLALAGLAMFAIVTLSSHLRTMQRYLDALALSALAAMVWHMGVDLRFTGPVQQWWLVVLLLIFWQVLRQAGLRQHLTLRRNYELQFRNMQLIESLQRQTQAALDAVDIKNRFLARATHDIRQPVHALGLYADWLASEPELVGEIAPKIVESTKAVNTLFDSLFDLARLESGKVHVHVEELPLDRLLRQVEVQYRPVAAAKGLAFRVRMATGTVVSDPILLQRIVGNLVSNAIKYTRAGGVLVAARCTPRGLRIEVWDTGVGIAAAHQRDIFGEFFKVPGHAGTEEGFGLGLYIVARLCHILGHPLALASRPGRGTVFRLQLSPTDAVQAARRAAALQPPHPLTAAGAADPVR